MNAFNYLDTISDFRTAFHVACQNYTHTTDFASKVNKLLDANTVDNADVTIRELVKVLKAYPEAAEKTLTKAFEAEIDLIGIKLPDGKTTEECLVNFTKPMLTALKA